MLRDLSRMSIFAVTLTALALPFGTAAAQTTSPNPPPPVVTGTNPPPPPVVTGTNPPPQVIVLIVLSILPTA
jgi:hypothetical protein